MKTLRHLLALSGALVVATSAAGAQMRVATIPREELPPAGMCRVWLDGVPANRQPAPTDCVTARAHASPHAHVIHGRSSNGSVYQPNDPRYGQQSDPRYDRTDPRYDQRNDSRYDARVQRERAQYERKAERERAKYERKRDKEFQKSNEHGDRDNDDHRDRRAHEHD